MITHLFVDRITWKSLVCLIRIKPRLIHVLDDPENSNNLIIKLLKLLKREFVFEEFFTGHLANHKEDEVCYLAASKKTIELSFSLSKKHISTNSILSLLNKKYGNNTLHLFLSKYYQINLFEHILKIETFKILSKDKMDAVLLINAPFLLKQKELIHAFPKAKVFFYNSRINFYTVFCSLLLKELIVRVKQYKFIKNKNQDDTFSKTKGVLTIQEDSIRKDQSLRGHLHWADFSNKQKHPLHTISLNHGTSKVVEDEAALKKNNIFIYRSNIFPKARKRTEFKGEFDLFNKDIFSLWKSLLNRSSNVEKLLSLKTIFLMYKARDLAQVCKYLNIKTYVIKETYFDYSDAIQLVSKKLNINTLAYQYSNLGYYSPMMMSSSDVFLNFSNSYIDIFKKEGLGPKMFKEMGYTSSGVQGRLQHKVNELKEVLKNKGVQFTIAYFDESNHDSRWRLIKTQEYKQHIVDLAQKIIDDPTLGVLIKTQFKRNVLHKKFKNHPIVEQALNTGRLIDVYTGVLRNDVYPVQVALAADICINDMVGATAGLEAVDAGKRCLLLNGYNYKTLHHEQYQKANIIYKDLSSALNAIDIHRKKLANGLKSDLGDWRKIKTYFLSDLKKSGINTIKEEVNLLLNSQ